MSSPEPDEVLYAYIAVAPHAVSLVLIRDDNGLQKPVYYVSKSLHEVEVRYLPLEKAILAVVHVMRKLPHYFQAHTMVVLTQLPLKSVLQTADYTGRIAIWSTILGAFDIKYIPQTSIKGQVLADLVAEFAEPPVETVAKECNMDGKLVEVIFTPGPPCWKVYVDGVANQMRSGVGLILVSPEKTIIEKSLRLGFSATNNEAEYEALLQGMAMVRKMGGKAVEMFSDLRLVVGQVKDELEARDVRMQEYLSQVKRLQLDFNLFNLSHVSQSGNTHADLLTMLATSSAGGLPRIILIEHHDRANEVAKGMVYIHEVRVGPSWMDPTVRFLKDDVLPEEKLEAEKIRRNASRFWLSEDHKLYKRSYSGPYLLCIHPEATELLLEEMHEGICRSHTGRRSLSQPLPRDIGGRGCKRKPWNMLKSVTTAKGPFPKAARNKRYLLVDTDYFTKWIKAKPLANIRDVDAKKFIWRNIVTRFGVPRTLVSDNGLQFDNKAFKRYCCELGITNRYSTPANP
ncbi:uncharacterized protein LOC115984946 [Quercus lobata]|uniref:uncharacterized protein LOC115984946 n=1 Tax=Quercus lobata TaxID=97700 RepID=UPI001243AEE6|nr:uncharacterized protein LOC115984946 [Quercus lobata]